MSPAVSVFLSAGTVLVAAGFSLWQWRSSGKKFHAVEQEEKVVEAHAAERERDMNRRMYELAILKELGERVGYSLNIQNIVDIITGSLHQFIEYSAVSSMLVGGEKIIFKTHLEKSVSRSFIDDVKGRMLRSLSALTDKEYRPGQVEEFVSGAILLEDVNTPVASFFNIPLVIRDRVQGVLTVAHTAAGLYKEAEMTVLYKITQQASRAVSRLEEVVETEERKMNAMVESMAEGVLMTDRDYRVLVVNPAALTTLGIEKKANVSIFDFIDRLAGAFDIRGRLEEAVKLDKMLEPAEVLVGDRFLNIAVAPVKSRGIREEDVLGGVAIFRDITREKELQKLREDFTAMMVHELRSPLAGINTLVGTMAGEPDVKKDRMENLKLIEDSSARMLELINDLLDVAKIEAGKFEARPISADITKLLEERIKFFAAQAAQIGVRLSLVLHPNLPHEAKFDPKLMVQVLNNLISNGLKFTSDEGTVALQAFMHKAGADIAEETRTANINWFANGDKKLAVLKDSIVIGVTDSGQGIPQSEIPNLFSKFKQLGLGLLRTEKKGTGLGLVIVKGIAEAHGGIAGVASEEGKGSTFYITIPLGAAQIADRL